MLSMKSYASCQAIAETWGQGARQNEATPIFSHHEYIIKNETTIPQHYTVCFEVSTQRFNHSEKFTNQFCEGLDLAVGQESGRIAKNPSVTVRYGRSYEDYYVSIDAITDIRGQCASFAHTIKKLKVYQ